MTKFSIIATSLLALLGFTACATEETDYLTGETFWFVLPVIDTIGACIGFYRSDDAEKRNHNALHYAISASSFGIIR